MGNWKGTGKDRHPILDKGKGKERFPIFCLEDRKGPHSRKNGQVNMYGCALSSVQALTVDSSISLDLNHFLVDNGVP